MSCGQHQTFIPVVSTVPLLTPYNIQTSTRKHTINKLFMYQYLCTYSWHLIHEVWTGFSDSFHKSSTKTLPEQIKKTHYIRDSNNLNSPPNRLQIIILILANNTLLKHTLINADTGTNKSSFLCSGIWAISIQWKLLSTCYYCNYVCYLVYYSRFCLWEKVFYNCATYVGILRIWYIVLWLVLHPCFYILLHSTTSPPSFPSVTPNG